MLLIVAKVSAPRIISRGTGVPARVAFVVAFTGGDACATRLRLRLLSQRTAYRVHHTRPRGQCRSSRAQSRDERGEAETARPSTALRTSGREFEGGAVNPISKSQRSIRARQPGNSRVRLPARCFPRTDSVGESEVSRSPNDISSAGSWTRCTPLHVLEQPPVLGSGPADSSLRWSRAPPGALPRSAPRRSACPTPGPRSASRRRRSWHARCRAALRSRACPSSRRRNTVARLRRS